MTVNHFDAAIEMLQHYAMRGSIDDWHHVVKSGCRVNEYTCRHRPRHRLANHPLTLLPRGSCELPSETKFTAQELRFLRA